ncbi:hypothetical protein NUU61_003481 [Penicillium alfredii]|uniref:Glutathione synthetase n=1 Tax=Penicillium alfredii TaxID=1506179 RepID=A0A9W9FJC3_9EURO|nr:uncharacterized protein NUU61_003481 [Penicillium alfredii]KAJ5101259.1 hypothetical protein NUU61_003481 [Penicillium alfredii]
MDSPHQYPPEFSDEHILELVAQIKDWQVNHGFLLKLVQSETEHSVLSHPVGVSVFPTLFPRSLFHRALDLQRVYNQLYCAIAEDERWLFNATKDLIPVDPLAAALWRIHNEAKKAGFAQDVSAGIFRSDYMLHCHGDTSPSSLTSLAGVTLKQVEFNAFSCAGGTHANKAADMHRFLAKKGAYSPGKQDQLGDYSVEASALPPNTNIQSLASCLASAHAIYGPPKSSLAKETAVLFIVQPNNFNIADERPIEYALWDRGQPIPTYRLDFGHDVLQHTWLTDCRELLFHPPGCCEARILLEKSAAIKCPTVLSHLSTFKKVQQALTAPGVLEHFLSSENAAAIRGTFIALYPLDESNAGMHARSIACDEQQSADYILKPSREGGGHNIYSNEIPDFLARIPQSQRSSYILMERIRSPSVANILMGPAGIEGGEVISELGVFGCCLWRKEPDSSRGCQLLENLAAGWSFKTKHADIDEMSVVKGFGCFDTPLLVDKQESRDESSQKDRA